MRWLLLGALMIAGCDGPPTAANADMLAKADAEEVAVIKAQGYHAKYGGDDARQLVLDRDGTGYLGGLPVRCGTLKAKAGAQPGLIVRAMRVGQSNLVDGEVGRLPGVYDELWRRAGC